MTEAPNNSRSASPIAVRSTIDRILRLGLTLAVGVLVWNCFLMYRLMQNTRDIDAYAGRPDRYSVRPQTPAERQEQIRADFPLPLYPGAREMEFGRTDINGEPFYRCEYDVRASGERVLQFYRQRLKGAGWMDTSDALLERGLRASEESPAGILGLQDEAFLRYYDHQKKTQATFIRRGASTMVAVAPGERRGFTRVGVRYSTIGDPVELARLLGEALAGDAPGKGPPVEFSQSFGPGETMRTRIHTGTQSARKMRDNLVNRYLREGWTQVDLPREVAQADGYSACLIRGRYMIVVNATRNLETRQSRAIVTTMGPG
jgi:hypothetical protein